MKGFPFSAETAEIWVFFNYQFKGLKMENGMRRIISYSTNIWLNG